MSCVGYLSKEHLKDEREELGSINKLWKKCIALLWIICNLVINEKVTSRITSIQVLRFWIWLCNIYACDKIQLCHYNNKQHFKIYEK